jgi:Domain of unknown function (DUF1929)/Abnormal spindle-like microcephaly-assoc'd, ASPM-SPD-2-Hydin/Galactose oxidase, central domain/Kelch motif
MKTRKYLSGNRLVLGSVLLIAVAMAGGFVVGADPSLTNEIIARVMALPDETDVRAPVDYGAGPDVQPQAESTTVSAAAQSTELPASGTAVPTGTAAAATGGLFGAPITWPVIPIHSILLPDGRVMSYGTNAQGQQGAELIYDVWNPSAGTGTSAHSVLPNSTGTDIFCSTQSLMLSGDVLTSGGDLTVNGKRNSANNHTTLFSPSTNTLTANASMTYARWYGTMIGLPNGQLAVFGGRQNVGALTPVIPSTTPEIYNPALGSWTTLTGANSTAAFGANWWYPRALVAPGGQIFVVDSTNGKLFWVSTAGSGSIAQSSVTAPLGNIALPSIPFAPGKLLSVRDNQVVVVIDYTTPTPTVTQTAPIDQVRFWANGTVLADGRVVVTGGSAVANKLTNVDYTAEIWDPNTGQWTAGASASKPRLYHSTAVLLTDGTVLTGGGGAPGPLINLNAEIYYPPYLYAADGTPAVRPTLSSTGPSSYDPGATLTATVGPTDIIARLTMLRMGSATHSTNDDQRFIELSFTQSGQTLTATLPGDTTVLVPGFYMLFAINTAGVPSVALTFPVTTNAPASFALSPASVPFGTVATGSSSAGQAVTLTNNGGTLTLSSIGFTGPGSGQFSQTNSCGSSVAGGANCAINVVYTPTAGGYTWATLSVNAEGTTQTAAVNGTGSVPFGVSPATVSFGKVPVGTTGAAQAVTVTNLGSAPLSVSGITLTGSAPTQFSQTNNCSGSIAGGSTCTINVTFAPAATGYIWAKLNVSAPGATHSSTVSGTGT